ncbi:hypothetical protein IAQ67_12645 [Paenibacillus peoriae]|uniref:Alpha/beta hydrolase n=1 Tax=Paenibacillus peoriae TaxID=59893 RepID=A0A7H0YFB7_9BACL|nr:alpha/beta fold hydrolase [Paenibacillus peoriae]QNR69775.1 hypothetical protein IAQ67_12645 [Paenibacillus peoriae]
MINDIIILCISGRGGVSSPSGITKLRNRLRTTLQPLGIDPDRIFRRSWNKGGDDDPFGFPDTDDLKREIERRSNNIAYLAIIGHSYGGWAACRLSHRTSREPDFIALLDPVFGPINVMGPGDSPRGKVVINWDQSNGIKETTGCPSTLLTCVVPGNGISCGYNNVPNATNNWEYELKNWDGDVKRRDCGYPVPNEDIPLTHVNMDDNEYLHHQICDRIYEDVKKILLTNQNTALSIILTNILK